ncbi:uncharacterized protein L201_005215 [Kwoniella dendrophila CBS 6074]|uniref:N-acetyltransferase domain-containing protein n=1 Tax=Kwoniella dendrophila CBS 6074 TaxID=1295534 RepID=A0AAX4K027_9TREE
MSEPSKQLAHSPVQQGPEGPFLQLRNFDYRLTTWKEEDVDDAVELFDHPNVGKWACLRPFPYTPSHFDFISALIPQHLSIAQSFLSDNPPRLILEELAKCPMYPLSALRQSKTGKVVGSCNIGPSQKEIGSWEIAYDLHPDLQGKGIAKEMVKTLLEFSKWIGIEKVVAFCEPFNIPSSNLLKKLGFTYIGEKTLKYPEEKGGDERVIHGYSISL